MLHLEVKKGLSVLICLVLFVFQDSDFTNLRSCLVFFAFQDSIFPNLRS